MISIFSICHILNMDLMFQQSALLGRKSLLVFIGSLVSSALGFVCLFLITNFVGVEAYGQVILMVSILTTINVVADLGFSSAHIKRISEGCDVDDCISTFVLIKVNLICVFVLLSFGALLVWLNFLGGEMTAETRDVFLVMMLFEVCINLASIALVTFQGQSQVAKVQLLLILNPLVRLPLIIGIAFIGSGAVALAITYMLGAAIMMLASFLLLHRTRVRWRRPTLIRSYIVFTLPLVLISVIVTVSANLDKIVIGLSEGDVFVGYYSTVQTFLGVLGSLGAAVAVLTFPNFSMLFKQGRFEEIREKSWMAERYISMLAMPIVVLLMLFPGEILSVIFGPDLANGAGALRWLTLATFLIMLNQVHSSQILAANRPELLAKMTVVSFAVGTLLLLILVPEELLGIEMAGLGMVGAAIAALVSTIVIVIMTRLAVREMSDTRLNSHLRHADRGVVGAVPWGDPVRDIRAGPGERGRRVAMADLGDLLDHVEPGAQLADIGGEPAGAAGEDDGGELRGGHFAVAYLGARGAVGDRDGRIGDDRGRHRSARFHHRHSGHDQVGG